MLDRPAIMAGASPSAGQILDGRFRLIEQIGRGGMATIFKAEDLADSSRLVVVKVPLPIFAGGGGSWSFFQQEEAIGRRLDHPLVLRFVPLAADKRRSYVTTEYVPGRTLADHLKERGVLPESEALRLASQLCTALDYLHGAGIVHYDLKPANVMVCPDGTIRLIDFGMAHQVLRSRFALAAAPPAIGSSGYVAPEQARRKRGRPSVDIYGVGTILYEMLTGAPPFVDDDAFAVTSARQVGDPPSPAVANPALTPQAEEIVLRALRRDPGERYPSAASMKADLDHPERVHVSGLRDRLQPPTAWRRRGRLIRYLTWIAALPLLSQVVLFRVLWLYLSHKH